MMLFFGTPQTTIFALQTSSKISDESIKKLTWLLNTDWIDQKVIPGFFIGPRATMITPWSTNAVEITQNMGIEGIDRIETFRSVDKIDDFDPMLSQKYENLDASIFDFEMQTEPIKEIFDIEQYNQAEGLSLNSDEVAYLNNLSKNLNRPLTDSEVFGFSQVNSEHCRHKIFNGQFILDCVA